MELEYVSPSVDFPHGRIVIPCATTREIPIDEFPKLHKKLWEIIAAVGPLDKPYLLTYYADRIIGDCFACEYSYLASRTVNDFSYFTCKYCPIKIFQWHGKNTLCCDSGPHSKWLVAEDPEEARKLALEIANLEWVGWSDLTP